MLDPLCRVAWSVLSTVMVTHPVSLTFVVTRSCCAAAIAAGGGVVGGVGKLWG